MLPCAFVWAPYICMGKMLRITNDFSSEAARPMLLISSGASLGQGNKRFLKWLILITIDMVKKAISQVKAYKAPGPSGIVVEIIPAAGDTGTSMIRDLTAAVICDGKVPSDLEQSFIVCHYKVKEDALERGNY